MYGLLTNCVGLGQQLDLQDSASSAAAATPTAVSCLSDDLATTLPDWSVWPTAYRAVIGVAETVDIELVAAALCPDVATSCLQISNLSSSASASSNPEFESLVAASYVALIAAYVTQYPESRPYFYHALLLNG